MGRKKSQSPYQRGTFRPSTELGGFVDSKCLNPLISGARFDVPFGNCSKQSKYTGVLQKNQAGTGKKLKKRKLLPENISGRLYKMLKNKKIEIMQKNCSQVSAV